MSNILDKAQAKQTELSTIISGSRVMQSLRPLFHFSTPGGWCNDPNGFSQFGGKIHLFYQYHPYSTSWGPMHWGHSVTKNMLEWEIKPVALAPDNPSDCKGCFSGSALEHNGKHLIIYTGVSSDGKNDIQNQCLAEGDGETYIKSDLNPVITSENIPFEFDVKNFRDPKIWKKDGKFYLLCVIRQNTGKGALVMFESSDAKVWRFKGMPDSSLDGLSGMWECPDYSIIGKKDVLIFSPQEMKENEELGFHNGNNSVYMTGQLDYENCTFTREIRPENGYTAALVDYGIDFYAPQTAALSDGRIIMTGWMQAWESFITPKDYLWSGMMTLPRELSLINGRLCQTPVRELESWKNLQETSRLKEKSKAIILENEERHFEIDLKPEPDSCGLICLTLKSSDEQVFLELDTQNQTLHFDRTGSRTPGVIPERTVKLRTENKNPSMKVICDTSSLEVFLNDGIMTFTNAFFFSAPETDLILENGTNGKITYSLWKIRKPADSRK